MRSVTEKQVTDEQMADLIFANKLVKQSKSNAIVFAKNGMLLASGIGQTSRVDALKQAVAKAHSFGFDLKGAVMASDAFFPFSDCVELAHEAGVDAVIAPGRIDPRPGEHRLLQCERDGDGIYRTETFQTLETIWGCFL